MSIGKNPLTPRETAIRLIEHMDEKVTYADIIRQLQILQDIERTMNDVELGGFPGDDVVREARTTALNPWRPVGDRSDDRLDSLLRRAAWLP